MSSGLDPCNGCTCVPIAVDLFLLLKANQGAHVHHVQVITLRTSVFGSCMSLDTVRCNDACSRKRPLTWSLSLGWAASWLA